jgi:chaperonin GroES
MDYNEEQPSAEEDTSGVNVKALIEEANIAEHLSDEELVEIGIEAKKGFDSDMKSREEWDRACEDWTKLAKQTVEPKTYPWPRASNIKYPLLSTAAMQFAARAYPSLIPSDRMVVKGKAIGKDLDGKKRDIAEAVSIYMSYQLLDEMEGWEEEMDKMLIMLPIIGTMFKKTYWDSINKVNCSKLVMPKDLVVDYWTKSLLTAERISEIMYLNPRMVKERVNAGIWLDVNVGQATLPNTGLSAPSNIDDTTPYTFIEQHTYLDLDDDEYKEPYIVTFHRESGKVVRIAARFDHDTIVTKEDGTLVKITPIQYYTKFGFVPNPDGGFYDIGFGVLLGPINESVNTLINQLVDAGHLSSLQSGFLGKGLRLRMGETRFQPGEWKVVNASGDDLKKQIVPLPTKEPSNVLFELMGSLITSGKELASVAEIFVGKMPGQNTPATTTMASIEQGMKVFTAVYKRIYRALGEEFKKLYRLNGIYIEHGTFVDLVDMEIGPDAFDSTKHNIFPGADPTAVSQTERLLKAQGLLELMGSGMPLDPVKVMQRVLEAQEQPNWQELIPQQIQQNGQMPPPPPDPKVQAMQAKSQADAAAAQQDSQIKQQDAEMSMQKGHQDLQAKQAASQIKVSEQAHLAQIKVASELSRDQSRSAQAEQKHVLSMRQSQEAHQVKMTQTRQTQAAKSKGKTKK